MCPILIDNKLIIHNIIPNTFIIDLSQSLTLSQYANISKWHPLYCVAYLSYVRDGIGIFFFLLNSHNFCFVVSVIGTV